MFARRLLAWGLLGTLLWTAGCINAPKVQRSAETDRFGQEMQQRVEELQQEGARPLTMAECEELALANSLGLRVQELALKLQDEDVRIALSQALPRASLAFEQTERSNDPGIKFDSSAFGPPNGGGAEEAQSFSFEDKKQQRLFIDGLIPALDWGVAYYGYEIAKDRRRQEQLVLDRSVQTLRRDVRVTYARHAGAIRQAKLSAVAYQAAQQVLRVAQTLEREGLQVAADTAVVEAAVAQAALALSINRQSVEQTHLALSQLMSLPPGVKFAIFEDAPPLPPLINEQQLEACKNHALSSRPELFQQDLEQHIAANDVKRAAAEFFPRLDLVGTFNWSSASTFVNPSYFTYGYRVTHSLLDGGATIWRYGRAKQNVKVEQARALLAALGIVYEVELQALQLKQAYERVQEARVLETARRAALNRIVSLYEQGMEDEASTARSVADLTQQATVLDQALTDSQVAWYELSAAALIEVPDTLPPHTQPTTQPATQPNTQPGIRIPAHWQEWFENQQKRP